MTPLRLLCSKTVSSVAAVGGSRALLAAAGRRGCLPAAVAGGSSVRAFSFSFAGPRKLNDIVRTEMLLDKTGVEVADIWYTYHSSKDRPGILGLVLDGKDGNMILSRAASCPFFVQPVFREDGFFMMVSQFQEPNHFLMAYLEDYKMDPGSATPLLTFSVFDDYADTKDVALVRCDILNKSILDAEGRKIVNSVLENYRQEMDYGVVKTFNERPKAFDIDDYISRMSERWQQDPPSVSP